MLLLWYIVVLLVSHFLKMNSLTQTCLFRDNIFSQLYQRGAGWISHFGVSTVVLLHTISHSVYKTSSHLVSETVLHLFSKYLVLMKEWHFADGSHYSLFETQLSKVKSPKRGCRFKSCLATCPPEFTCSVCYLYTSVTFRVIILIVKFGNVTSGILGVQNKANFCPISNIMPWEKKGGCQVPEGGQFWTIE